MVWGIGDVATFKAVNVESIIKENEQPVRTWHPALASVDKVRRSVLWELVVCRAIHLNNGCRHTTRSLSHAVGLLTPKSPNAIDMHFRRDIDPRRFLHRGILTACESSFYGLLAFKY
jgi:hypothetical protein